jgi:alkanesulfonate monooxygenase SsuD/methylene tetrahydromethanopterin reductase-like flavin-dependent oxidoreductase (luciferase family)
VVKRSGIAFTPFETRTDLIVRLAAQAEARGLHRVDVAEGWTHDSTILLVELAMRTLRIEIGTMVVSVWGRTPATMAMAAAGLQRCSNGRFSLGIGAGSPPLAEGFHRVAWEHPLTRLRETLTAVRALLNGDRLPNPAAGARPLRLGVAADPPVPMALAALSPASIRLARELSDAWAPFLWAHSRL